MASSLCVKTPSGNTGLNRQATLDSSLCAHVDYLVACGYVEDIAIVERFLHDCFGVAFDWSTSRPGVRGKYYEKNCNSPSGASISANCRVGFDGSDCRIVVPGSVLSSVANDAIYRFGSQLLGLGFRFTRIDIAVDDFERQLDIDELYRCVCEGKMRGAKKYKYIVSSPKKKGFDCGKTLYLGSGGSDKITRIYDKNVESVGLDNCVRWETQFRDELGQSVANRLFGCGDPNDLLATIVRDAIASYSFVDPTSSVRSRCQLLEFWSVWLSRIGEGVKISAPKVVAMLSDKKRWVERQVVTTLALISHCIGWDDAEQWLLREIRLAYGRKSQSIAHYKSEWMSRLGGQWKSAPF